MVAPDLVLAKTDSGDFQHGGAASFTLTASNTGSSDSSGLVTVTDTVPASLPVGGASGPGWSRNVVTQTVTCTRSDAVAAGASYPDITIDVTVGGSAPSSITNTASVSGGLDGDPSNNDATDTVTVSSAADVAIIKSVSPTTPVAGDAATFTLTVFNNGPSDATGIEVDDPLPANLTNPVVTPATGACSIVLGTVECSIASLASGQNTTIEIAGTVQPSAAGTTLANTATVSANEADPDTTNNSSTVSPTVTGVADLGRLKNDDADAADGRRAGQLHDHDHEQRAQRRHRRGRDRPAPGRSSPASRRPPRRAPARSRTTVTCPLGTSLPARAPP